MDDLRFYVLFPHSSVISGQGRHCALETLKLATELPGLQTDMNNQETVCTTKYYNTVFSLAF